MRLTEFFNTSAIWAIYESYERGDYFLRGVGKELQQHFQI